MRQVILLLAVTSAIPSSISIYRPAFPDDAETLQPVARWAIESADGDATPDPEIFFKPEALLIKDQDFMTAYRDGFTILSTDNNCSRFFGGTIGPPEVFSQMLAKFRKGYLDVKTGIQMSGGYDYYKNVPSGFSYRLFGKEIINTRGAFYKKNTLSSGPSIPWVGHFAPNSREARVLMLLHELAHLIKSPDGRWLIPDDGFDDYQSSQNSRLVEKYCGEDILKLK